MFSGMLGLVRRLGYVGVATALGLDVRRDRSGAPLVAPEPRRI